MNCMKTLTTNRSPTIETFVWIIETFNQCPAGADDEVIQQYAHTYVWYATSMTFFADVSGRSTP